MIASNSGHRPDSGLPELFGFIVGLVIGVIVTGLLLS